MYLGCESEAVSGPVVQSMQDQGVGAGGKLLEGVTGG